MEVPEELIAAKELAQAAIMDLPGVTGVGIGMWEEEGEVYEEDLAVRIYVEDANAVPEEAPTEVGGVAVCFVQMTDGPCVAPDPDRYSELRGGIRIAQPYFGAGTFGAIVKEVREDEEEPNYFGLSSYHVVGGPGEGFPGIVWQPREPNLTGTIALGDSVGEVVRAEFPRPVPLVGGAEVADVEASIFALQWEGKGRDLSTAIAGQQPGTDMVEAITASELPSVGQLVRKRGFVSRVTEGIVIDAHKACYWKPGGPNHYLAEQIVIIGQATAANPSGIFAEPGDSGAVILDAGSATAVGLLYGRGEGEAFSVDGKRAVASKMRNVERALGITPVL